MHHIFTPGLQRYALYPGPTEPLYWRPMKLLQVMASNKPGGAERFFCRLAESFSESPLEQAVMLRKDSPYVNQLPNIHQYHAPFGGGLDFKTPRLVKKALQQFQPDIVLTWMNRASHLINKQHHAKNYVHVARLGGYYNLKYYQHCDHFIGNTRGICDYLVQQGVAPERVHYISNFVTENLGTPQPRPQQPLLVALGRLHPNKAFDTLIQAMVDVPDAVLWIGGTGPLQSELQQLIDTLGLAQRVKLLGWLAKPEDLIASADVFICPSRHEPLGNVILEAWAQGKPIVATRSQGACELIRDNENGLLADIDNAKQLAEKINTCLKDQTAQQQLAAKGQKTYFQHFSRQVITERYLALWSQL